MLIRVIDQHLKVSVCESEEDYQKMLTFFQNNTSVNYFSVCNGGFDVITTKENGEEFFKLFNVCDKDGEVLIQ